MIQKQQRRNHHLEMIHHCSWTLYFTEHIYGVWTRRLYLRERTVLPLRHYGSLGKVLIWKEWQRKLLWNLLHPGKSYYFIFSEMQKAWRVKRGEKNVFHRSRKLELRQFRPSWENEHMYSQCYGFYMEYVFILTDLKQLLYHISLIISPLITLLLMFYPRKI